MDSEKLWTFWLTLTFLNITKVSAVCSPFDNFECDNGNCVSKSQKCDQNDDCGDNSDELYCKQELDQSIKVTCNDNEFPCLDGTQCVLKSSMCDREPDCKDQSDETVCASDSQEVCGTFDFKCFNGDNECVPKDFILDGYHDCADGSDEIDVARHCNQGDGKFLCDHEQQCISMEVVCDSQAHCSDRSDEGEACNMACQKHNCSHNCQKTPSGGICACLRGYHMNEDGETCTDIDECLWDWLPACSQVCTNAAGNFTCSCKQGYSLMKDHRTCALQDGQPAMMYWDDSSIHVYFLSNNSDIIVASHMSGINTTVVGPDWTLYWTVPGEGAVYQSSVRHPSSRVLLGSGLDSPSGLAVDWLTSNLYIVDPQQRCIFVCNGGHCAVIMISLNQPHDIAVNPETGMLLWTDWGYHGDNGVIGQSCLDGTESITLLSDLTRPRGVTFDPILDLLFYIVDRKHHPVVELVRSDGTGRRELTSGITWPYSIDILAGQLYWTNKETGTIKSADKLSPYESTVVIGNLTQPYGVRVYHPVNYITKKENPCKSTPCSHLCVPGNRIHGYSCLCPVDMELQADNITCKEKETFVTIFTSSASGIFQFPFPPTDGSVRQGRLLHQTDADVLAVNPVNKTIVYYDVELRTLATLSKWEEKTGSTEFTPLYSDIGMVEGIAVDWYTGIIYWTATEGKIYKGDLEGGEMRILRKKDLYKPRGIILVQGYLYYSDWGVHPSIQQCNVDGTECNILVKDPVVSHPNALAISYTVLTSGQLRKNLYWTDSKQGVIGYILLDGDFDAQPIIIHIRHSNAFPFALAVSLDTIFFTDSNTNKIHYFPMRNVSGMTSITVDRGTLYGLAVVDIRLTNLTGIKPSACSQSNGGCSHTCQSKPGGQRSCLCPNGWQLLADQVTCYNATKNTGAPKGSGMEDKKRRATGSDGKVLLVGILVGAALIIGVAILAAYLYIRRRRAGKSLLEFIQYRRGNNSEEVEELVPNIIVSSSNFRNFDDLDYPESTSSHKANSSQISVDSAVTDMRSDSNNSSRSSHSSDSYDI